jgi:hypothetical protein
VVAAERERDGTPVRFRDAGIVLPPGWFEKV